MLGQHMWNAPGEEGEKQKEEMKKGVEGAVSTTSDYTEK